MDIMIYNKVFVLICLFVNNGFLTNFFERTLPDVDESVELDFQISDRVFSFAVMLRGYLTSLFVEVTVPSCCCCCAVAICKKPNGS